jgi:hypothetical protein
MQTSKPMGDAALATASNLPRLCFVIASATVIAGMCLGFYMGIKQDFTLTPVHAHMNLLGWVSLFLLGLYYRTHPYAVTRMARFQVGTFVVGHLIMVAGMAAMFLVDHDRFVPMTIIGGMLLLGSMAQFLFIAWLSRETQAHAGNVELASNRQPVERTVETFAKGFPVP